MGKFQNVLTESESFAYVKDDRNKMAMRAREYTQQGESYSK